MRISFLLTAFVLFFVGFCIFAYLTYCMIKDHKYNMKLLKHGYIAFALALVASAMAGMYLGE